MKPLYVAFLIAFVVPAQAEGMTDQVAKKKADTIGYVCQINNWASEAARLYSHGEMATHLRLDAGRVMRETYQYDGFIPNLRMAASKVFECAYKPESAYKCEEGRNFLVQYLENINESPAEYLVSCAS